MVDFELKFQGWLEEATLFPAEPNDYGFNFDEILSEGKANDEAVLDTSLPDLDWLDAPADFNILDDPKGLDFQQPFDNPDPLNLDDAASLLLGLIDSNLDTSYLSSNVSKDEINNILNASAQIEQQVTSPETAEFILPSPYYESISEASSPASVTYSTEGFNPDLCLSPNSSIDDGGYESVSEVASPSTVDYGTVSVTVCDVDTKSEPLSPASVDEVKRSVRKRKYARDDDYIPEVKVSLKNVFHPYAKATAKNPGGKVERKKVQNKEAAARYRFKKRIEEQELSGEVACLEKEQEELRKKHDGLVTEIKYLKNLMREVLQKRGVL